MRKWIILVVGFIGVVSVALAEGTSQLSAPVLTIRNSVQGLERVEWAALKGSFSADEITCLKMQYQVFEASQKFGENGSYFTILELAVHPTTGSSFNLDVPEAKMAVQVGVDVVKRRCEIFSEEQIDGALQKAKASIENQRIYQQLKDKLKGTPGVTVERKAQFHGCLEDNPLVGS